jgi:hypothetical protein
MCLHFSVRGKHGRERQGDSNNGKREVGRKVHTLDKLGNVYLITSARNDVAEHGQDKRNALDVK